VGGGFIRADLLKAHEHYRKGRNGEAMVGALKDFESTMKAICDKNGWSYDGGATAKTLVKTVLDNGLVPKYHGGWRSRITSKRSIRSCAKTWFVQDFLCFACYSAQLLRLSTSTSTGTRSG
jgi:hypothetical protein